jgi:hypothetical protein
MAFHPIEAMNPFQPQAIVDSLLALRETFDRRAATVPSGDEDAGMR